jgi:hypothetical protein
MQSNAGARSIYRPAGTKSVIERTVRHPVCVLYGGREEMREKTVQFLAVAVAIVLLGMAALTVTTTASKDALAAPRLSGPADLERYGIALTANVSPSDMWAMGIRWYQNWQYNPTSGMENFEFHPMAIPSWRPSDTCAMSSEGTALVNNIRNSRYPTGTTWLIGNEVGASWPGATQSYSPDEYAQRYYTCYMLLKGLKPGYEDIASYDFQIANGAVLPTSGPYNGAGNGLDWFRAARAAYRTRYGQPMPVDVYNIHLYTAPNEQGYWALVQAVTSFRSAMRWDDGWNDAQKPVIVTEIGVREDVSWDASISHLTNAIDYMSTATDRDTGYATDNYRLIQRWAWYCDLPTYATGTYWDYTHLYNSANSRSTLGNAYAVEANSTPTATPTRTRTPTITPTPTPYLQRVNVGGPAYTDIHDRSWAADQPFAVGSWGYGNGTPTATTDEISGTNDPDLYQDYLLYLTGGSAAYRFTVPNGQYDVTLKFSEDAYDQAGLRVFDVSLEKAVVLPDFDIYAAAGGKGIAVDEVLRTNVTEDVLHIGLKAKVGQPKIDAIYVQWVGIALTPTPTSTTTPTMTPSNTATKTPAPTRTRTFTPTVTATITATRTATPAPAATPFVTRVNAGGVVYTDAAGRKWKTDHAFISGGFGYVGGLTTTTAGHISGTGEEVLFQTARQWSTSAQPAYKFTVPNGVYTVRMRFAETALSHAGQRVFDIKIKGLTVLAGFDIYAAAGGAGKAVDRVFTVTVLNGMLPIQFGKVIGNPMVNAIEIVRAQ